MKPKMIMFHYGQTLITEDGFNALEGNKALLDIAIKNPNQVTIEQIQKLADNLFKDVKVEFTDLKVEITSYAFNTYLYEYLEIEFAVSKEEVERIFWKYAAPGKPTKNVQKMLGFLQEMGIRTAVVSNMMNSGAALTSRLNELLPDNQFEFIITSSDYIFRKPHRRIFEMALRKAGLKPEEVWFCGDNLYCDIQGAYSIGMKPIWYPAYSSHNDEPEITIPYSKINDWDELSQMLM